MKFYSNALGLIGNTPLVCLNNLLRTSANLYAKAEFMQPGGSVKDRAALQIIQDAYKAKMLQKGQPVVEMTSGNMGAGLVVVCNILGNPFTAVMSVGNSPERKKMLEALGAKVVLTPQKDGSPGIVTGNDIELAVIEAKKISGECGGFYVDQFNNESSVNAHYFNTGPEIFRQLDGKISCFVAAVGSGGTFLGISKFLKQNSQEVKCIAVEPEGSEVLAGKVIKNPKHNMQGIGYGKVVPHWDSTLVDGFMSVSSEEAVYYKRLLAEKCSLHVGFSSAANVCASVNRIGNKKIFR